MKGKQVWVYKIKEHYLKQETPKNKNDKWSHKNLEQIINMKCVQKDIKKMIKHRKMLSYTNSREIPSIPRTKYIFLQNGFLGTHSFE